MTILAEIAQTYGVSDKDLSLWIERRWVLPLRQDSDYVFGEADLARVGMIAELRRDVGIDDEAMPVVLNLLDQLYGMRRHVRRLITALDALPADQREAVLRALGGESPDKH
jgi:chaperone modulatory protein CbpM